MVLRSFAVTREEGYVVMPGGLSRVAPSTHTWVVSNQLGGVSKDVWVLASEPERQVSLLTATHQPVALTRDGDDVPGRVADDLFWLGRYAERTEGSARLLHEVLLRMLGSERAPQDESLPPLLNLLLDRGNRRGQHVPFQAADGDLALQVVDLLGRFRHVAPQRLLDGQAFFQRRHGRTGRSRQPDGRVLDARALHDHHDNHDAHDAGHDVQEGIAVDGLGMLQDRATHERNWPLGTGN